MKPARAHWYRLIAVTWVAYSMMAADDCEQKACDGVPSTGIAPGQSLSLRVGEEKQIPASPGMNLNAPNTACAGVAEISYSSDGTQLTFRGLAPGGCEPRFIAGSDSNTDNTQVQVTVVSEGADGSASVDGGPPVICSAQVAKVGTDGGRDLFMAYTDVDSGPANQACPIHTSTDYRGDVVFSFLGGSPGYRINGRGNYVIESATPATLENEAFQSSAVAVEDQVITIVFHKRIFADEDAGTPPSWTMSFRMSSDPDPAKWRVDLLSVSQQ